MNTPRSGDLHALLRRSEVFRHLRGYELDALAAQMAWFSPPGGATLLESGDASDAMYLVCSGSLGAFGVPQSGGGARLLGVIPRDATVDELGLISGQPRAVAVRALRDSELLRLPRASLEDLVRKHPEAMLGAARVAASRLLQRLQQHGKGEPGEAPRTFAILPFDGNVDVCAFPAVHLWRCAQLARSVARRRAASSPRAQRQRHRAFPERQRHRPGVVRRRCARLRADWRDPGAAGSGVSDRKRDRYKHRRDRRRGCAYEWDDQKMCEAYRRAFVDGKPLADWTLSLIASTRGDRTTMLLREAFGEINIEDLPLDFACFSTDLTSGCAAVHRNGLLWRWLRASSAVPGILPPPLHEGHVCVDGAVINNLPTDVLSDEGLRRIIAVDISAGDMLTTHVDESASPPWPALWKQRREGKRPNAFASLLLRPDLEAIGLLDWHEFERAIAAGYGYTRRALENGCL